MERKKIWKIHLLNFQKSLKPSGLLLTNYDLPVEEFTASNHVRYSLQNNMADAFATNITMHNGGYEFDVMTKDWMLDKCATEYGWNA